MNKKFQIFPNLIFLLIIVPLFSISPQQCLNNLQPKGSCTACNPSFILKHGYCFKKIRGCLIHQIQHQLNPQLHKLICTNCQNGYILQNKICIRQALLKMQTEDNKFIPPLVVYNPGQLTIANPVTNTNKQQKDDIENENVEKNGKENQRMQQLKKDLQDKFRNNNEQVIQQKYSDQGTNKFRNKNLQIMKQKQFYLVFNELVNKFDYQIPRIIKNIQEIQTQQSIIYQIIFNQRKNAIIIYYKNNSTVQILQFNIDGVNQIQQQQFQQQSNLQKQQQPPKQQIQKKIIQPKQQVINPILIKKYNSSQIVNYIIKNSEKVNDRNKVISFQKQFNKQSTIYKVNLLTLQGLKQIQVKNNYNQSLQLSLQNIQDISKKTCVNIQLIMDDIGQQIDIFLRNKYSLLKQYKQVFVQYRMMDEEQIYRFLYSNPKFSQVQIIIKYFLNTKKYQIQKGLILNHGYQIQDKESLSSLKLKQLSQKKYPKYISQTTGTSYAYFMTNQTHARLYFTSMKASYQYINKKDGSQSGKLFLLQNKQNNQIPEGFQPNKILTIAQIKRDRILYLIVSQIKKKYRLYFGDRPVSFVQKNLIDGKISYDIVLKTNLTYYLITGNMDSQEIVLSSLRKITLVQNKQMNCLEIDDKICTKCKNNFILDKNMCYKKIQGCKIQLGNLCIVCYRDYVQMNHICLKDCDFFI